MTRIILPVLFISFSLTVATCKYRAMSAADNATVVAGQNQKTNRDSAVSPTNSNPAGNLKSESATVQKPFFVILGSISSENGEIRLDGGFWGHDANEEEAKFYPDDKVEIDIMNCAGYIASAVTNYKGVMREVKLLNETIAKDAVEKIKQCSVAPNSEIIGSDVFGIAPAESRRRNTKIDKTDDKKLYNSLRKDIATIKNKKKNTEAAIPELKGTKEKLSLGDDNWTDSDGDGQIDLIEFYDAPCAEKDSCTWIFRLTDGKWKAIEYVFPM